MESNTSQNSTDPILPKVASAETNHTGGKEPKKKALLVGVRGNYPVIDESSSEEHEGDVADGDSEIPRARQQTDYTLKGPHNDVDRFRELLIDKYTYKPEDIKVLKDDESLGEETQPTHDNILNAIFDLIADASPGDQFAFLFAGHSLQKPAPPEDIEEEDGMNEYIQASDGCLIQDNTLRSKLVTPLPSGCKLTAIFDSCHSCTLLDLKHYRCNRVFVPWKNGGRRRTNSFSFRIVRQHSIFPTEERKQYRRSSETYTTTVEHTVTSSSSGSEVIYCDGNCRNRPSQDEGTPRADVICISSSQDDEQTWEGPDGKSMTQHLIEELREDQTPLLQDLMTKISYGIHEDCLKRHSMGREYKKKCAEKAIKRQAKLSKLDGKPEKMISISKRKFSIDTDTFQNPAFFSQLSSDFPLDMKRTRFCL